MSQLELSSQTLWGILDGMPKWKTEDVAYFTRSRSPAAGSGGRIWCAICPWEVTTAEADVDSIVADHLAEIHANHVNEFGFQKTQRAGLPEAARDGFADGDVVYYVRVS